MTFWRTHAVGVGADEHLAGHYAEHSRSLLRLAVLLVTDVGAAEAIMRDAFAALYGQRHRARTAEEVQMFLRQSVVFGARSSRAPSSAAVGWHGYEGAVGAGYGPVIDAIRSLPRRQHEALVLRYYACLSEEDAAAAMGVRLSALRIHLAAGMSALRPILEREPKLAPD
jgi:DNA-directed RNA polymerase specialized sigma24 family protein